MTSTTIEEQVQQEQQPLLSSCSELPVPGTPGCLKEATDVAVNEPGEALGKPARPRYGNLTVVGIWPLQLVIGPCWWGLSLTWGFTLAVALPPALCLLTEPVGSGAPLGWQIATTAVGGLTLLALCLATLTTPGLEHRASEKTEEVGPDLKWCGICELHRNKDAYHCHDCGVCVRGWDHHCSFMGKCIGRSNLLWFYFFVLMLPICIVYGAASYFILHDPILLLNLAIGALSFLALLALLGAIQMGMCRLGFLKGRICFCLNFLRCKSFPCRSHTLSEDSTPDEVKNPPLERIAEGWEAARDLTLDRWYWMHPTKSSEWILTFRNPNPPTNLPPPHYLQASASNAPGGE